MTSDLSGSVGTRRADHGRGQELAFEDPTTSRGRTGTKAEELDLARFPPSQRIQHFAFGGQILSSFCIGKRGSGFETKDRVGCVGTTEAHILAVSSYSHDWHSLWTSILTQSNEATDSQQNLRKRPLCCP